MDHHEAVRRALVEKYLLHELSSPDRDEFEEHYFDCVVCAEDLKSTAAFLRSAQRELRRGRASIPLPPASKARRFAFLWRPAFVSPVIAFLLVIIGYQNMVMVPELTEEVAGVSHPEILPSISLIGASSRGGTLRSITITPDQPLLLSVDIPAVERFSSYSCVLVNPSGATVWQVAVSAEQAKDTVSMRAPAGNWREGEYHLVVQGYVDPARAQPAELATYRFALHVSN